METLAREHCVACRRDAPRVTAAEVAQLHPQVAEWELVSPDGIDRLRRVFAFDDFGQALAFTNTIGELAEAEGHHPALLTEWGRTTVTWWTHKIKGLHRNDFVMAAKTDGLYARVHNGTTEEGTMADDHEHEKDHEHTHRGTFAEGQAEEEQHPEDHTRGDYARGQEETDEQEHRHEGDFGEGQEETERHSEDKPKGDFARGQDDRDES